MKKIFSLLTFILVLSVHGQSETINYTASSAIISNPERGLYKSSDTFSNNYIFFNESQLTDYRLNDKITLVYKGFYLNDFKNSAISQTYLDNIQTDLNTVRNAGLKIIMRFAYTNNESDIQKDATKATILSHIAQLQPIFSANADIILALQAGFIGVYGEWYYTSQADFGGFGYNGTPLTTQNYLNRKEVVDALLNALPSNRMVQLRTPYFKREMFSVDALNSSQAFDQSNVARIGHHNDCFLASESDFGTYINIPEEYPYLAQETQYVPMGGETCVVNSPRTDCTIAQSEMALFHWSYLNLDYNLDVIANWTNGNCFTDITNKLGYRFQLNSVTFPEAVFSGESFPITIRLQNLGFSTPFNDRKVYLILKGGNSGEEIFPPILLNTNPRFWFGNNEIEITENVTLPANMPGAAVSFYLYLPDATNSISDRQEYAIQFANENTWDAETGYNNLNHIVGLDPLGNAENLEPKVTIYPNPSKEIIYISLSEIKDYQISLFSSVGSKLDFNSMIEQDKMTIDTKNLSNGFYFLNFKKESKSITKKIIIKH